jgi:hypothetical protein
MVFTSALIPAFSPQAKVTRSTGLIPNHPDRHSHSTLPSHERHTPPFPLPGERIKGEGER